MKRFLFLVGLLLALATPDITQAKTDTLYFEFDIVPNAISHELVYQFWGRVRAGIEVEYHDGQNQGRFKAEEGEQRMTVYGKGYWKIYYTYEYSSGYTASITPGDHTHDIGISEYGVYLTSLDVSGCIALGSLSCENNQLTSLDVSGCTALDALYCYNNQLTSLDVSHNSALRTLYCGNNQLISLDVSGCTALTELWCNNNQLTSLDASHNTALTSLECNNNQLTSLDVGHNSALKKLYCNNNQLTSLVVHNPALEWLYCNNNQLTSLNVSGHTTLGSLSCENNQLSSLDVSGCIALGSLSCENNQLSSLDVSGCIALGSLSCENNQLTSLDVSHNTALTNLHCHNNQLTSLDVSHNTALELLWCHSNQLTSLDISNTPALTTFSCYNNHIPLSTLYDIYKKTSRWTYFSAPNQTDTLILPFNQVLDLSSERMLGENLSTFTLSPDSYTEEDFVFRFHKPVEYELTLQNSAIPYASITYYISIELPDNYFTVQVASNNTQWGTVTIEGEGFYEKGSDVTITATPNEGYCFVNWTKQDGSVFSTEEVHTFVVTENLELTANFEKLPDDVANESQEKDNLHVYTQDRTIHLSENRGIVQVFNTLGRCVYNGTSTAIRVRQTGVYIVTVAGKNYKVLVM